MTETLPAAFSASRYAMLRSFRADGSPVDTPIWFHVDGATLVFRTKRGPKTRRLTADPHVELRTCDYKGRNLGATIVRGGATLLDGAPAEAANTALRRRYGWQWNIVPLLKIPGVTNVHSDLSWREKLRRATARGLWPDSAIVSVLIESTAGTPASA
jgi:PPOX class probable F420-dependent enzyme